MANNLEEQELRRFFANLSNRVIEDAGFSKEDVRKFSILYTTLVPGDREGPISIKRLNDFLNNFIKKDNPKVYEEIMILYEFKPSERVISDKYLTALERSISCYLDEIRTIENARRYSYAVDTACERISHKLDAPEMDSTTKVKWLKIWFFILSKNEFFYTDYNVDGSLLLPQEIEKMAHQYVYPEYLIIAEKHYFSKLDDGDIIYELLKKFIDGLPQKTQNAVYRFAELTNQMDSNRLDYIRSIKLDVFRNSLRCDLMYLMQKKAIAHLSVTNIFPGIINAYKNGGIANMPSFEVQILNVKKSLQNSGCKWYVKNIPCYQFSTANVDGKELRLGVYSQEELLAYVNLYHWLLKHPDFKFADSQKTLAEYKLDNLLFSLDNAVSKWILDCGYAANLEDINWELANYVLCVEENAELFTGYYNGELDSNAIFQKIGFKSERIARLACSFTGLKYFDDAEFKPILKRLRMFGIKNAVHGDIVYHKIFTYLIAHPELEIGKNGKTISSYKIVYPS